MKLETFFEKFDQFADAPDAVAKMRELVLELAVHGKLVAPSPNPDKHPAWLAFRKEISERVYSYDPGPPPPFEIPAHWEWCVLDEVADCRAAAKVSPAAIRDTDWVLDLEDIDGTTGQIIQTATFAERRSLSTKAAFEPGDVLYGKLRPYLNKVVVAAKRGFCTTEIIPLRPAPFLTPEFLRFYLRSQTFLCYAAQKNYGMKMPRLGTKDLESAEIPVPPPAEQKRIVAKVDELMALCDRLALQQQERETRHAALSRASLARFADAPTPANLNLIFHSSYTIPPADLRKSIFTLAVQGKLVHRIESEGLAADILKQAGVSEEPPEDVPELPTHWIWARLGSIATRMDSGWSPACIPEPAAEGEWGVLKTTAVQTLQYQEVQNKALPPNLEPRPEHEVMDGDILFTRAGPMNRVGILCVARPTRKKLIISDKIIRFHLVVGIDPDFAALSMNAGFSSTVVEGLKSGMAASQVNISQPKLRSVPIPFPPLAEQRRIVAKVEQLMALVDALEQQLAASRATAANLLSALVAELTGTPNDGKVSVPSTSTSTSTSTTGRRGRPPKS